MTQPKTAADYARLPEGTPIQLIDGEFIMSPSPLFFHQLASSNLHYLFAAHLHGKGLGTLLAAPFDVHLSDQDVYQPDLLFVSKEHDDRIQRTGLFGAPDLVVEILSPSTERYDIRTKKNAYQTAGVSEYWIVDPEKRVIEVFVNSSSEFQPVFSGSEGKVCSSILKGFCIEVSEIFRRA